MVEHCCFFMWYLCQLVLQNFGCVECDGSHVRVLFVIRKLEPTISDILFFSGTRLVFVD